MARPATHPAPMDVLMPVRNAAATLPACLASLDAQTLRTFRLVAVDDGSRDDSRLLLDAYARRHCGTKILSTGGKGLVAALNLGLTRCTAPLVARMDADDTMAPARLARQNDYLDSRPAIGVAACRVDAPGSRGGFAAYLRWSNRLLHDADIRRERFIESPIVHPSACFRRELVTRCDGYREGDFPEDYELWLRWLDAGVSFAKLPDPLLCWPDHSGRLTRTDPRYHPEAFFEAKAPWLIRWLDRHSPRRRKAWVWGAGLPTRRRIRRLAARGLEIEGFIDIDPRKIGRTTRDGPVFAPESLPGPEHSFVLAAVGARGARDIIRQQLIQRGYREGETFLCVA